MSDAQISKYSFVSDICAPTAYFNPSKLANDRL